MTAELPEVLTRAEAWQRLRIGRSTLDRAIAEGRLPVVRLGRRVLIRATDLARLLDEGASR